MRVTFLDYLILMFFFSFLDIRKRNNRSHGKRKNGNLKRLVLFFYYKKLVTELDIENYIPDS